MATDPSTPTHPGAQIKERRTALGLSHEGLAYKAGVSARTIARLESEENIPRRATLRVIEAALEAEAVEAAA